MVISNQNQFEQLIVCPYLILLKLAISLIASQPMFDKERKNLSFNPTELSYVLYGGKHGLSRFLEIQSTISSDPVLRFNPELVQIARKDLMALMAKRLVRYHELFPVSDEMKMYERLFFTETMPLGLHFSMFMITLENLSTEEQRQVFLEPAKRNQIFGCYAQTELAHGSDVQSLMTTATLDKQADQFVINTPCVDAVKWWIGELGVFATHAVLVAQLIIDGKKHGTAVFVVQIRDTKTNKPLPGVVVGDIGPKYGYMAKDNGYLQFTNVRIPRNNMLMKYTYVSQDGKIEKRGDEKMTYATLLALRTHLPRNCYYSQSKAVTIATRYSLLRKQFRNEKNNEVLLLDYLLQQQKIIPHIAEVYACFFTFSKVIQMAKSVIQEAREQNKFTELNPTHALSSGIKAVITADTLRAMETLRRSAGGHGFSSYSGLPGLQSDIAPTATFEGENTVLLLQTARFLVKEGLGKKEVSGLMKGFVGLETKPMAVKVASQTDLDSPKILCEIFRNNAHQAILAAVHKLKQGQSKGLTFKQCWDSYAGLSLVTASTAFIYHWIVETFAEAIPKIGNESVRKVLTKVLGLYACCKILENAQTFFYNKILNSKALNIVEEKKAQLLKQLRNEAIGLVEAFEYDDNTLASAIGREDGKAYETLYDWAKNYNQVNKPEQLESIQQLRAKLQKQAKL